MALNYGYVRSWDDPKYVNQLKQQGYAGALFQWDDPRLPQLVEQARAAGVQYGLWGAPNQTQGPELTPLQMAQRMAAMQRQYGTNVVSFDLEFPYKGYEGSQGWQNNQELANYWRQMMAPGTQTIIAPLGSQWAGQTGNAQDFNFNAWKGIATGWNPQAYGAMLTDHMDPAAVARALINAGIPADQVAPLLAPGQNYGGGALYGLNEFGDLPLVAGPGVPLQGGGGQAAPTRSTSSTQSRYTGPPTLRNHPRLSQSMQMVANQGLRWGGGRYKTKQQFSKYLASKGRSYKEWAQNHPQAARGLLQRSGGVTQRPSGRLIKAVPGRGNQLPLRPGAKPKLNIQKAAKRGTPYARTRSK